MLSTVDAALLDALDRHARRREEGIATLSVLAGPRERALALWTEWVHRRGLRVVVAEGDDPRGVVTSWATALASARDLASDAEAFVVLSQPTGYRRELLFRGKTAHERRVLLEGLTPPASGHAPWELCCRLLEAPSSPGMLPEAVREAIAKDPLAALQALCALVPASDLPALRVRTDASGFRGLRLAASLCAAAPTLNAACVAAPEFLAEHLGRGESHAMAMLREGLLDLPEVPEQAQRAPTSAAVAPTLARLQQEGTPEPVVALYAEAARAITAVRQQAEDRARSEAERFLYGFLQHQPSTRGLFTLNAPLDVGNGRALEVDLLCRELRLAVELDGYHHFRDAERFRRDRRKDLALQRAGYWVVRFLADDVVSRLEEILSTLDTLIAARRQETPHGHR